MAAVGSPRPNVAPMKSASDHGQFLLFQLDPGVAQAQHPAHIPQRASFGHKPPISLTPGRLPPVKCHPIQVRAANVPGSSCSFCENIGQRDRIAGIVETHRFIERCKTGSPGQLGARVHDIGGAGAGAAPARAGQFNGKERRITWRDFFACGLGAVEHRRGVGDCVLH